MTIKIEKITYPTVAELVVVSLRWIHFDQEEAGLRVVVFRDNVTREASLQDFHGVVSRRFKTTTRGTFGPSIEQFSIRQSVRSEAKNTLFK